MTLKSFLSSLKVKLSSCFRYLFIYSSVSKVVTVMIDLLLRLNAGFQTGNKRSQTGSPIHTAAFKPTSSLLAHLLLL